MPTEPSSTELPRPGGRLLEPAVLKALSRRSTSRGAVQLLLHLCMLATSSLLVAWARETPALLLPAMVLHGWLLLALFAPLHETAHHTAFASRRLNASIGWLCGLPAFFNWHYYQLFHFAHHRHTQDAARDPELTPAAPRSRVEYLARLTGWHTWKGRVVVMTRLALGRADAFWFVPDVSRARLVASARGQLALTLLVVSGAILAGHGVALLGFWIAPVLLAMPLMRGYLLVEHTGCSDDADGLANTRTTISNVFVRLSMWNMPFHAEHHLFPSIPFHALPAVHRRIAGLLHHVSPGYLQATARILRDLPAAR